MKRVLAMSALVLAVAAVLPISNLLAQAPAGPRTDPTGPVVDTGELNPPAVRGTIDAVTVYRGQALVTRSVDVPGNAGLTELIVTDLPDRVIPGSLFAESADGVSVRSVRYRIRPVSQDVREEVRKLDDEIKGIRNQIEANRKAMQVLAEQRQYLEKLSNFTAPTASVEMSKGVLNAEQLKQLTTFQFEQRAQIAQKELQLSNEHTNLSEQLSLKERQRNSIASGSAKSVREAVIFLNQEKPGGKLRVRYLVDGASWTPSYNVRATSNAEAKGAVNVEYQASIEQMSGEDWNNVTMTLSTATPALLAAAPTLNPLEITLAQVGQVHGGKIAYDQVKQELMAQRDEAELQRSVRGATIINSSPQININVAGNAGPRPGFSGNWDGKTLAKENDKDLNRVAEQLQVLELVARDIKKDDPFTRNAREGIVVTYALDGRTSLPSRSDRQLIQIAQLPMKSNFYKTAIPVLTNYVYDEAEVTNNSKMVLLAGPLASYMDGQFVGSGEVPTVAIGQPFTVGFGIDSSLRASRERLDRTEDIQGGNKVVTYAYRVAIDNYGTSPAQVRVYDRVPTASDHEVKVTLVDKPSVALSEDKQYQESNRKKGILRWDVTVPPGKNGIEAFSMTYKMQMEYDKSLQIAGQTVNKIQEIDNFLQQQLKN